MNYKTAIIITLSTALLSACSTAASKDNKSENITPKNQKFLNKLLANKTAGEEQRCVNLSRNASITPISDKKIIFRQSGNRVFVNQLEHKCNGLDDDSILVFRNQTGSGRYCRGDIVKTMDRFTKIEGPFCRLGEFVPYTKSKPADAN